MAETRDEAATCEDCGAENVGWAHICRWAATTAWWPETEADEDELCRRAMAALAEVGLSVQVGFVDGFIWVQRHTDAGRRPQIEKACELAWQSMTNERTDQ